MFDFPPPPYPSVRELMAADARGELDAESADDHLWYFVARAYRLVKSPEVLSGPMRHYIASRRMEWEVGNGGFAQAAYNIPHWFEAAAEGYDVIGLPLAAARIRQAKAMIEAGHARFSRGPDVSIGTVFAEFAESELTRLNDGLDEIGWWATEVRMAYVRANRAAFVAMA